MNIRPTAMNVSDYKWINLIRDRLNSGLTVEKWCGQRGISPKTYYYHQTRLRRLAINGAVDKGLLPECLRPGRAHTVVDPPQPVTKAKQAEEPSPVFTPVPMNVVSSIHQGQTASVPAARITRGNLIIEISCSTSESLLSFLKELLCNA
jgi:hypothetical protein